MGRSTIITILFLICLLPSLAFAKGPFDIAHPTKVIGVTSPDKIISVSGIACTRTTGTYLSEGFEGTGYEAMTGNEFVGTNCTLEEDNTDNLYACGGSQNLKSISASSGYLAEKAHILATDQTSTFGRIYLKVVSSLGGSTPKGVITIYDDTFALVLYITLWDSSGLYIGVSGGVSSDNTTISYDAWHYVEWKLDIGGTGFEWWVDGVSQGTDASITGNNMHNIVVGWDEESTVNTGTVYFDLLDIHSSQLGGVE